MKSALRSLVISKKNCVGWNIDRARALVKKRKSNVEQIHCIVINELDGVISGRFAPDDSPVDVSRVALSQVASLLPWIIIAIYGRYRAMLASDAIQSAGSLRLKKDTEIPPRR